MCILALDLGTTAFKCAPVTQDGLSGPVATVSYALNYDAGRVTYAPEGYFQAALQALEGAARAARDAGLAIEAIGISSQAQTYIPLDQTGRPLQDAVVWTDGRAVDEAAEVARAIPDFAAHSGFRAPLPEMFLPKVMHYARHGGAPLDRVWKFLLLNEYIVYRLTGEAYGDETNQGMSGFYDITRRRVSPAALGLAGIGAGQLADIGPGGRRGAPLRPEIAGQLGLPRAPVCSCGNDQSAAAAGAGLRGEGDVLCNFGTAMVVYALKDALPGALRDKQIAGISPWTGRYFLLGVESECGNVLDWARAMFYRDRSFEDMLREASAEPGAGPCPRVSLPGGGRVELDGLTLASEPRHAVLALLRHYAGVFGGLLDGVAGGTGARLFAAGGLSRSQDWLTYLGRSVGVAFARAPAAQPGLVGVARIIQSANHPKLETVWQSIDSST
jgi:xylulokinase